MNTPRIGIHLSTSGGVFRAAERAHEIGANTFQIFSSSPRMWRPARIDAAHALQLQELRREYDCTPLVIHTSYLVNLCSQSQEVCRKSVVAFRGEVERALTLGAEYLVLHPGSWRGLTREAGLRAGCRVDRQGNRWPLSRRRRPSNTYRKHCRCGVLPWGQF